MRKSPILYFQRTSYCYTAGGGSTNLNHAPIIRIDAATFYQQHPSSSHQIENSPLFPNLTFHIPSQPIEHTSKSSSAAHQNGLEQQHWAVIGNNTKTTLLEILRGSYISIPPKARTYPYLSSQAIARKDPALSLPSRAIQYVGFAGDRGQSSGGGVRGAYLSARYESRREESDWSVLQYLKGETELNPTNPELKDKGWNETQLNQVIKDLRLGKLVDMPVANLSNGQTRRARIAKALLRKPELLLLDEPFMGLDPPTLTTLSPILRELAYKSSPRLVLSLRPQDPVPDWVTHLLVLGEDYSVSLQGECRDVLSKLTRWSNGEAVPLNDGNLVTAAEMTSRYGRPLSEIGRVLSESSAQASDTTVTESSAHVPSQETPDRHVTPAEPLIELKSVVVKYGPKVVLGGGSPPGLDLTISRGSRLLILGPNGSGKTTLLSLLTSDHPQSYGLPVFHFGRSRLPTPGQPGISIFDIQSRMGHSSPEIHAFFPHHLSIRATLESAWSETFISPPSLPPSAHKTVDAVLRWFEPELNPHHHSASSSSSGGSDPISDLSWSVDRANHPFSQLPFSTQRLLLLLRALIKKPDIIILDEAFSGLSPYVREKAIAFLEDGFSSTVQPAPNGGKGYVRSPNPNGPSGGQGRGQETVVTGIEDRQALVVVSHVREEVPGCVNEWVRLPGEEELEEARETRQKGVVGMKRGKEGGRGGVASSEEAWRKIWGL